MIDLAIVLTILDEVTKGAARLHQQDLDETNAVQSSARTNIRAERAQKSQDLQYLAGRLELAAALIRNEYWIARGKPDPLKE